MEVKSTTQLRTEYLARASKIISGPREEEYGSPHQNFGDCAALWTTYLIGKYRGQSLDEVQFHLTPEDVAHLNVLQKIARTYSGNASPDTYIDIAGYGALAGECAEEEKELRS